MPMLAYEQFGSVSYMTSVNGVMATLEALNLVAHQVSMLPLILLNNFVPLFIKVEMNKMCLPEGQKHSLSTEMDGFLLAHLLR